MKFPSKILFALAPLLALLFFPRWAAAQVVWSGGNTGVWNVPGNWTGGVAPGSGTNAVVDSGTANFTASVTGLAQDLTVGNSSTGGLWINGSGADLVVSQLSIAQGGGSHGNVTVTNGLLDDSAGSLAVGTSGSATLVVNGGTVEAASLTMGRTASIDVSSGTFSVSGDSHFGPGGSFGSAGTIVNGGYFSSANDFIGGSSGLTAATVASGTWASSGTIAVGITTGSASMTVNGGYVSSAAAVIGSTAYATSTISSGTWSNSGTFTIGGSSFGSLSINNTGVLVVGGGTGEVLLGSANTSTGTLHFGPGGTLEAGVVTSGNGSGIVDLDITGNSNFDAQITGNVTVNLTGTNGGGSTTFSGSSTYNGTTTVSGAALTVNGSIKNSAAVVTTGTLAGSGTTGNVTVNAGSLLEGTLTSGVVQVNAGGTVEAGDAPGENTMTTLTLSGSATYQEEIDAPGSASSYTGTGNHPIAGTDYGQTTLTGPGNGQTAVSLDSTNSILRLNVVGNLPAGGVASAGHPYNPAGSNSSLDNYFVLHLSDSTDTISGKFAQVTLDGTNYVTIDYSSGNLVGNSSVGTFTLDGTEWAISYTGDEADNSTTGGDDVALTALMTIPEPSTYALLAMGGVALAMVARRRKINY